MSRLLFVILGSAMLAIAKGRAQVSFRFNILTTGGDRYDMQTASISRMAPATKGLMCHWGSPVGLSRGGI